MYNKDMTKGKKRFIIIDSNALIHRAYHALPPLTTKKGEIVNAVYGFLLVFLKVIKELKPDFVLAAFDVPFPTFRHKKFKEYKAKRQKAPDELYAQIPKVKEFLRILNVPIYEKEGFEADDIIGTMAKIASRKLAFPKPEIIILTGDLDTLQLINKNIKVYTLKKGVKDAVFYDEEAVKKRYGLRPEQLVDFRGLKGDPSDNIPGVSGIGEKTAIELIKEFGSLENLYQKIEKKSPDAEKISQKVKDKLIQSKEQAFFSKFLSQIKKDAPVNFRIKDWEFGSYNQKEAEKFLKELEFYSLIARLPLLGAKATGGQGKLSLAAARINTNMNIKQREKENTLEEIEKLYKDNVFSEKIYKLEKALAPVVEEMERNGIKIDAAWLLALSREMGFIIKSLEEKIYGVAREKFNINSSQQISHILFENLKLSTAGLKKTPGGVISTSWSELEKLKDKHPIIEFLEDYRELFKLKSGFVDSLPKLSAKDGRLHPKFHQLGTATGRFSCSDPNLQNIPIKGDFGRKIRQAFIVNKGFKMVSADYSQMELRIAAAISKDKKMIEFFRKGKDIHKMTASQIFNIPENKVGERERSLAKTINFGVLYGMSALGLARAAGISMDEARNFIDEYFNDFGGIAGYVEDSIETVKKQGYSETLFGRKRFLSEINSIDFRVRQAAERMAINHPVQGSSADIIKMAMVEINQKLKIKKQKSKMILQIHDELLFESEEKEVIGLAKEVKEIMENTVEIAVPLKVDIRAGDNWGDLKEIML